MPSRKKYLEAKTLLRQIESVVSVMPEGAKLGTAWQAAQLDCEIVVLKWQLRLKKKLRASL